MERLISKVSGFQYKKEFFAIVVLIVGLTAVYQTFLPLNCVNFTCFQERMNKCSPAIYVNEEPEASWRYEVRGIRGNQCMVEVSLLSAKEGELNLRKYEGNSMNCFYEVGVVAYPEKDLEACHGELKENLQKILIDKLYKYIVSNIGEIKKEVLLR